MQRQERKQGFILPSILILSLALTVIGIALLTYASNLRGALLKTIDQRVARDAALSGFEYGRDQLETVGAGYAGTDLAIGCSDSAAGTTRAPYTVQATTFCASFRVEVLASPNGGANGKQIRATGVVYRMRGGSPLISTTQVYVGNISKPSYTTGVGISATTYPGPNGIVSGPNGVLWFVDRYSHRLATISTSGGITEIERIPMTTANQPFDIAVDGSNKLWFTELNANRIGYYDPTAKQYSSFSLPSGCGPTGITRGPDSNMWITCYSSNKIIKMISSGVNIGNYGTPISITSGSGPMDITTGPDNNLWFTLYNDNSYIGRVTTAGAVTTYALPSPLTQSNPRTIALSGGSLWFTTERAGVNKIGKVNFSGTTYQSVTAVNTNTSSPTYGIAKGSGTDLWFTLLGTPNKVGKLTTAGAIIEYAVDASGGDLRDIALGPDGNMWYAKSNGSRIGKITVSTPSFTEYQISRDYQPSSIIKGPDGNYWSTAYNADKILKASSSAILNEYVTPSTNSRPQDLVVTPDNKIWTGEYPGRVAKVNDLSTGTMIEYQNASSPFAYYVGLIMGPPPDTVTSPAAFVWAVDFYGGKLVAINYTNGVFTKEIALPGGGNAEPRMVAKGPDGNLWVTLSKGNAILKVTPSGVITSYALASGATPYGIVAGPDGNMWFTQLGINKVSKITMAGVITDYAVPTADSQPLHIISDGNSMWFTELKSSKIGRITTAGAIREYAVPTGSSPFGLTVGFDGDIWFASLGTNRLDKLVVQIPAVVYKQQLEKVVFRDADQSDTMLV